MPKYLVIDTHEMDHNGESFDNSHEIFESKAEMVTALSKQGGELLDGGYFDDWRRGLRIFEIVGPLPLPGMTVAVTFPEDETFDDVSEADILDLAATRRQREALDAIVQTIRDGGIFGGRANY